jgi:hypothetical protein
MGNDDDDDDDDSKPAPDPEIDIDKKKGAQIQVADCTHVFAMLVRFYKAEHNAYHAAGQSGAGSESLQEACKLIEQLATELDIVRRKYWLFELEQFSSAPALVPASTSAEPPPAPQTTTASTGTAEDVLCSECSCKTCNCTPIL